MSLVNECRLDISAQRGNSVASNGAVALADCWAAPNPARLGFLQGSRHVINLEEPALSNQLIERFLGEVERGSWRPLDPRAKAGSTMWVGAARK